MVAFCRKLVCETSLWCVVLGHKEELRRFQQWSKAFEEFGR